MTQANNQAMSQQGRITEMSTTKSIKEVQDTLAMAEQEMGKSDFKGIFAENNRGLHGAALSCVTTAIALLRLAEEDENKQNEEAK